MVTWKPYIQTFIFLNVGLAVIGHQKCANGFMCQYEN